jgi:glyoxylase-like metal-dependent hydrolase (beta-lactamase superfamily II)
MDDDIVSFRVGDATITRVRETQFALKAATLYPGFDPSRLTTHRAALPPQSFDAAGDGCNLTVNTWVLRVAGKTILVDTGIGNHKPRPFSALFDRLDTPWLARLSRAGVAPEDVDFVLLTHLHADHVGWNTRLENGRWVPTFPNARYLMARVEFEYLFDQHRRHPETPVNRGSFEDSVLPIHEHGRADLVELDHVVERELGEGVWLSPACGHTPGHVFVNVGDHGRERAVFTGDVIHHPIQFADPSLTNLADFDAKQAHDTRLALMHRYADTDTLLLTGHFPSPTAGRIVSHGDRFRFAFDGK